jgi:cytochrome c553
MREKHMSNSVKSMKSMKSSKTKFSSGFSLVLWFVCCLAPLSMPLSAFAQNASSGKDKAGMCTTCHGPLGLSQLPNAPHLAGQPAIYLIEQMKNYRSGKRPNEVMAVIAKPLTDQEIEDLSAWYASIEITVKVK